MISGYSNDWRCLERTSYALDFPDDSLASLGCLNTLMSFSWSTPAAPETTLILQNDLPLDEQLIASLPETPGLRFRVKKETLAAGSESGATQNKNMDENRSDESPQQVCSLLFHCHVNNYSSDSSSNETLIRILVKYSDECL